MDLRRIYTVSTNGFFAGGDKMYYDALTQFLIDEAQSRIKKIGFVAPVTYALNQVAKMRAGEPFKVFIIDILTEDNKNLPRGELTKCDETTLIELFVKIRTNLISPGMFYIFEDGKSIFDWPNFKATADNIILRDKSFYNSGFTNLHPSFVQGGKQKTKKGPTTHNRVYTGPKGGRYVLKDGKKVYV